MTPSQECEIAEALESDYSVRQICEVLDFTRSNFYYHPKEDPSEHLLRDEIEKLASAYPTYGYRRITKLLVQQGYPVGYQHIHEARERIGHFITQVYNYKRPHSALGYLTPAEFERQNLD